MYIHRWNHEKPKESTAESTVVETTKGPVEYDLRGAGPVALHFHGGNVAYNGWCLFEHLVENGYSLLTPSRPGYLATKLISPTSMSPLHMVLFPNRS
ncbi:MAG TPA: hypothetical protein DCE41_15210 [Cytophagales bacterium]|nr:hypothetical protein [Cytophagales bacterium]HAA17944.1 hypothetical protein [Cytophagales bacterium]HAP62750.1 hypothetical protein [Cytophagales bacterium]